MKIQYKYKSPITSIIQILSLLIIIFFCTCLPEKEKNNLLLIVCASLIILAISIVILYFLYHLPMTITADDQTLTIKRFYKTTRIPINTIVSMNIERKMGEYCGFPYHPRNPRIDYVEYLWIEYGNGKVTVVKRILREDISSIATNPQAQEQLFRNSPFQQLINCVERR